MILYKASFKIQMEINAKLDNRGLLRYLNVENTTSGEKSHGHLC